MRSDLNIMVANFRSRDLSILRLDDHHAANYQANIPCFTGDVESPSLIRRSICEADGKFRARRAGSPSTRIQGFLTLLRNNSALITNWATFYHDAVLAGNDSENETRQYKPRLHLPTMEPDGLITSVWNNAIIFRPRSGELAILIITRVFDSDMLTQQKQRNGHLGPNGADDENLPPASMPAAAGRRHCQQSADSHTTSPHTSHNILIELPQ